MTAGNGTDIADPIFIAIPLKRVGIIGAVVAGVRHRVAIGVHEPFAVVSSTIEVAVGQILALVGRAVAVAVLARAIGQVALIGKVVDVAVRTDEFAVVGLATWRSTSSHITR